MSSEPTRQERALGVVAEHYRDTFGHLRDHLHRRDRLFAYSLVTLVALSFRGSFAAGSDRVLKLAVERLLGAGVEIDGRFLAILLWFVFFAVVSRYFQANVTVERQYEYISRVEEEMCAVYGSDILAREGKAYLKRYPRFSAWMHLVYTWLFPLSVAAATVWSLLGECKRFGVTSAASWIVVAIGLAILWTVALYMYSMKVERDWGEVHVDPSARRN